MENEQKKFLAYEDVRSSGMTNMFDVRNVIALSDNLIDKNDCFYIIKNYEALSIKYL